MSALPLSDLKLVAESARSARKKNFALCATVCGAYRVKIFLLAVSIWYVSFCRPVRCYIVKHGKLSKKSAPVALLLCGQRKLRTISWFSAAHRLLDLTVCSSMNN